MSRAERDKRYYEKHKEKIISQHREYNLKNKEDRTRKDCLRYKKNKHLNMRNSYAQYGITLEDYNNLFDNQQGCCLICKGHQTTFKKRLAVDHCHSTGKVRGLLCHHCNVLLGYAKESITVLEEAIQYLKGNK